MTKPHILGLIPARGESKRVPRKNMRSVAGRPLISWTIAAAQQSGLLNRLIVSTDNLEIADISRRLGADAPFERPTELAGDETPTMAVVAHTLDWLRRHDGYAPDYVLLLQPTSPLRTAQDIGDSVEMILKQRAECVVSVRLLHHPVSWMKQIDAEGRLSDVFFGELASTGGGRNGRICIPNGAIYLALTHWLLTAKAFLGANTRALIMPDDRSLDVDTEWDLQLADILLQHRLTGSHAAR